MAQKVCNLEMVVSETLDMAVQVGNIGVGWGYNYVCVCITVYLCFEVYLGYFGR